MKGALQYGAGITAYMLNLLIAQMISLSRIQRSIHTVIGIAISEATISKYVAQLNLVLEQWKQRCLEQILSLPSVHIDKTSLRVDKQNHWIQAYSCGDITLKFLHAKQD